MSYTSQITDTLKSIEQGYNNGINPNNSTAEKLLYVIPYSNFNITIPENSSEAGLMLKDIFVAVKQRRTKSGLMELFYEIYDKDKNIIATTDENHRIKLDRDLLDREIERQTHAIEEAGLSVASLQSLDSEGRIETYIEMVGRELVLLNERDEREVELARADQKEEAVLSKKADEQTGVEVNEKAEKALENERMQQQLEADIGGRIVKSTRINDNLFYRNNDEIKSRYVYAVLTDKNELKIVSYENGKYVETPGFERSSNEDGRTNFSRNDDLSIEQKNTYGAIYNSKHPELRYTVTYGEYGEIDLIEQVEKKGAKLEKSDKYTSREVETESTNYLHRNLEGHDNVNNITERSFDVNSNNKDAVANIKGNYAEQLDNQQINKHITEHGQGDLTMEQVAQSPDLRAEYAYNKIVEQLEDKGVSLSDNDKEHIQEDTNKMAEEDNEVICQDDVDKYCDAFVNQKEQEEQDDGNERTLGGDAYNRRFRN